MKKILFLLLVAVQMTAHAATSGEAATSSFLFNYGEVGMYRTNSNALSWQHGHAYKNGSQMTARAYKNFLANTCPQAYYKNLKGARMKAAGWALFGIGGAMLVSGGIMFNRYWDIEDAGEGVWRGSIAFFTIGGVAVVSSVPLICVGQAKRRKSVGVYNQACSSLSWNITAGEKGLGVAMTF